MNKNALVIGSRGAIGGALVEALAGRYRVIALSRPGGAATASSPATEVQTDYSDADLARVANDFAARDLTFDVIVCCIGVLHDGPNLTPERRLDDLDHDRLLRYFEINAVLPARLIRFFAGRLTRDRTAVFACLSAMVGSIADNRLGGWYGYRASKAALNMIVKTAAIEVARSNRTAVLAALHPGTTKSPMSAPFTASTPANRLYEPAQSARRIAAVIAGLDAADSGGFFNWTGERLPY